MVDYAGYQSAQNCAPLAARGRAKSVAAWLRHAIDTLTLWNERSMQRSELLELPPHLLFDIGLTRADVEQEARKLPWQGRSLLTRAPSTSD